MKGPGDCQNGPISRLALTSAGAAAKIWGMPVIARFYGITIRMYFREHGTPHFHAVYGEHSGVFAIDTLELIEGALPNRA